jgi:hypothetical protein
MSYKVYYVKFQKYTGRGNTLVYQGVTLIADVTGIMAD